MSGLSGAQAQDVFDSAWYNPDAPYIKIAVDSDGVYRVTGTDLAAAGFPVNTVDPTSLQLFENGSEVPLRLQADFTTFGATDWLAFVGKRNTGAGEAWAYNYDSAIMPSQYNSLFTDTTFYWLTWGAPVTGLRYAAINPPTSGAPIRNNTRATTRTEADNWYYPGQGSSAGNPIYTTNEGYYQDRIRHNTSQDDITRTLEFSLTDASSSAADSVRIGVHVMAETVARHKIVLEAGLDDGGGVAFVPLDSVEWIGIAAQTLSFAVPQSQLPGDGSLEVRIRSRNNYSSAIPNNLLLNWVEVDYVRASQPVDGQLAVRREPGNYVYETSGLIGQSDVYVPSSGESFSVNPSGGVASFLLGTAVPDTVFVVDIGGYASPADIRADVSSNLVSPPGGGAAYVLVTTPSLRASGDAMAAHRASPTGGGHSTLVVDIYDIFDQFDYGRPTPLAIRRFVRAARAWNIPIKFLTMWGDALYPDRTRDRKPWEVLSFGHTASDDWFAMQDDGLLDYSPSISIGRLPIRSNEQGNIVVQKQQTYESAPLDLWQKNAVYLVGGATPAERQRLRQSARRWSGLVSGPPTTLDTVHFFKESANILDPTFKDSIQQTLQKGASWVTYFGHSATQTWEIVTDPPALYNNGAKLPVILSLGCFTGDFGTGNGDEADILSFSEQLVVQSLNGSIAHWGASSSGTIGASERFSDEVHQSVFTDSLRTLGDALREAKERYNSKYSDPISVKHLLQYGLIGDPATQIQLPTQTDFRALAEDIRITPFAPVPSDDELIVDVTVRNIGLFPTDTVTVRATHILPNGTNQELSRRVPPFENEVLVQFRLPIDDAAIGQNSVRIQLDADGEIVELDEMNNTAEQAVTVFSSGLAIAEPGDYALFPSTDVSLVVNTSSAEVQDPTVIFELDTLRTFDSPALMSANVTSTNLTAQWAPASLLDEQLYYWRARIDAAGQEDVWSDGSFTVREQLGQSGWYQAGKQFADNAVSPSLEPWQNGWEFTTFSIDASASSERGAGLSKGQFVFNGQTYERLELGFGLLVIDGAKAIVKASAAGPTYANDFQNPIQSVAELRAVAEQAVVGDYFMTRTRHLANRDGETVIPDSVRAIFRQLGSAQIDSITYQDMWIMFGKVGFPEETREFVYPEAEGVSEAVERFMPDFRSSEATITSPVIGPASAWTRAVVEGSTTGAGNIRIDVIDAAGQVISSGLQAPFDAPLDINVRTHPFVRLRATLEDSTRQSTPQLENWRVVLSPVAELAIDPATLSISADSVAVGTSIDAQVGFRNLSETVADSVVVNYVVIDEDNRSSIVSQDTLLAVSADVVSQGTIPTERFVGENRLRIDIVQPGLVEPISVNNVAIIPFKVSGDANPPTFAVTIDGDAYPNDPDPVVNLQDPALPFVSARPEVEVAIEDDFAFPGYSVDSTTVRVFLDEMPVLSQQLDVQLSDDSLRMNVTFRPDLSVRDSTHTLFVRVRDSRGNEAEGSPYQVHFRVQSAVELEEVYPYPNPMSARTRFAFRLRGAEAELIEEMTLRIYTVSGRLVRQFDLRNNPEALEAGALKIGWNKLLWDGTDSDGDRVATGVYLYRMRARAEGGEVDSGNVERIAVIR